jgi:hypothetical protein
MNNYGKAILAIYARMEPVWLTYVQKWIPTDEKGLITCTKQMEAVLMNELKQITHDIACDLDVTAGAEQLFFQAWGKVWMDISVNLRMK